MPNPSRTAEYTLMLWATYETQLRVLNDRLNRNESNEAIDPKIDTLLSENGSKNDWNSLYEAEQRLVGLMPESLIDAEMARRVEEAKNLGVKSWEPLKATFDKASGLPAEEASSRTEAKRDVLLTLLDDLHFRYEKRRLDRLARKAAARRLNKCGVSVLIWTLTVLLTIVVMVRKEGIVEYHGVALIVATTTFGLVGAFLSRVISFQNVLSQIDYDSIEQDFTYWSIIVKLITGALGAVVIYLLIAGNILNGELFPDEPFMRVEAKAAANQPEWAFINFAKLMIWSIVAGFSERLIPDQFSRLEGATRDTTSTPS